MTRDLPPSEDHHPSDDAPIPIWLTWSGRFLLACGSIFAIGAVVEVLKGHHWWVFWGDLIGAATAFFTAFWIGKPRT